MKIHKGWKKTAAFLMALALVTGGLPANVGGFLTGDTAIVASAETSADGITFSEAWSSNSLPAPNTDWYSYVRDTAAAPTKRYCYLNNDISTGTLTYTYITYAVELQNTHGQWQGYSSRKSPLDDHGQSSVYLCLNGHKINANGNALLAQADGYSAKDDFVYGFYGNSGANEVIENAASLGSNRGGTWVVSGVKLSNFTNIAELKGDVRWSQTWNVGNNTTATTTEYYGPYRATLNMKNTTADCANGVNIADNGTLNFENSSITSTGAYAVALTNGAFNISGNSEINGVIQIASGQKINFSNNSKMTGNVRIKLTGTQPTAGNPVVISSGASVADLTDCTFTSADGYYVVMNDSGELEVTTEASMFTVTWKNADGTILETDENVAEYSTPTYNGTTPTKAADDHYTYTFSGWSPALSHVTDSIMYTAQFTKVPNPSHFSQNGNTYTIHDSIGWEIFAETIAEGTTYSGKTILLDDDISTTKMAATSDSRRFSGIFDGQGHTLTVNYGSASSRVGQCAAPFSFVNGCTVRNLHVDGEIYTSGKFACGIASKTYGTNNITNCRVSITINSSVNGDGTHSGFVGQVNDSTTVNITGCVFDGKMIGTATTNWGGFVGWNNAGSSSNTRGKTTIKNSLFAPKELSVNTSGCREFVRRNNGVITLTNAYYVTPFGTAEGTRVYNVSADDNIQINYGNPTDTYNYSGLTLYGSGITCNGANYALNGKTINLSVATEEGFGVKNVSVNDGDVEVTDNQDGTYSFTMPAANATISAETEKLKYTITWQDEDGTELQSGEVEYGATPVYNGATPTKGGNEQYTYTFSGWSDGSSTYGIDELPAVSGNATYTAQFSSEVNTYTVYWKNGDTVLETDENVEYGTTPTYDGAAPTKTGTENEVYVFSGWDPVTAEVTDDVTYTAQFIKYIKTKAVAPTYEAAGNIEYYTDESGAFYTDTNGTLLTDLNNDGVVNVDDTVLAQLQPSMNIVAAGSKYDVNVYIPIAEGDQLSDYTVTFGDVEQQLTAVGNTNYGSFTVKCAAKNMADINTLVLKQGDTVLYTTQLSAAGYLKQFENDATFGNMAKSMLRYGAAAQTYFNVGGTLANDGVTGYGLDSLADVEITDSSPSVEQYNTAFALTNSEYQAMNMTYDYDTTLLIAFRIKGDENAAKTELEEKFANNKYGIACVPDNNNAFIIVKVKNIPIKNLGDAIFTFGDVSIKATDYLARIANNSDKSDNLRNLCKALYKFYESTK